MNPAQTQGNDMTAEDAKASLGIATALQDMHFHSPQQPQDTPPSPDVPPPQDPNQGVPSNQQNQADTTAQIQGLETRLMDELATLKVEMKSQADGKKEFNDFKKQIEGVLNAAD